MSINLDRHRIYIHCPRCNFWARVFLRQVKNRETIICGGCKANLHLEDYLGSYRKAERQVKRALASLAESTGNISLNLRF